MEGVKFSDPLISRNIVTNRRYRCAVHYHDEHELYYMQSGRTNYFIADEIYSVEKGDFVFIPKGILHGTDSGDCRKNSRILVNFPDSVFSVKTKELRSELYRHPVICVPEDKVTGLEELLLKVEKEYQQQKPYREMLIDFYILELLTLLCRYRRERKPHIQDSDRLIYRISEYIGRNYGEDISLEQISRQFSISESYLSRRFKEVTGIGFSQYITYVRISNAERLLKKGEMSVAEVAGSCGYNDSNYFSLVYKRIQGVTPFQVIKSRG